VRNWIHKTDEFGQIDYTWSPIPFSTQEEAYQALVTLRESANHDEFFRIMEESEE
jgi:hypothetical protein